LKLYNREWISSADPVKVGLTQSLSALLCRAEFFYLFAFESKLSTLQIKKPLPTLSEKTLCPGPDSQLLENVDKIKVVCRLFIDTMSKNCHLIQSNRRVFIL
jgi:hypothetical protein